MKQAHRLFIENVSKWYSTDTFQREQMTHFVTLFYISHSFDGFCQW